MPRSKEPSRTSRKAPAPPRFSVVIVDDHPVVQIGLRLGLANYPDIAISGVAHSINEAGSLLQEQAPDVIILDLAFPGPNGLDFLRQVKSQHPAPKVLILSCHEENTYAERALRAGARGYIMKHEPLDKLALAIRTVAAGNLYLSDAVKSKMLEKLAGNPGSDAGLESLTDREMEIFNAVGEGLNTRQMADRMHLSIKTVEAHLANIKKKLNLENSHALQRAAIRWTQNPDRP